MQGRGSVVHHLMNLQSPAQTLLFGSPRHRGGSSRGIDEEISQQLFEYLLGEFCGPWQRRCLEKKTLGGV